MVQNRDPRHRPALTLKVVYNRSSITKQWGKLGLFNSGAETNDYPCGKNEIGSLLHIYTTINSRCFRGLRVKDKTLEYRRIFVQSCGRKGFLQPRKKV